jgi:hypothetical protein
MNCPECHELLLRHLDGETVPDRAALDCHLAECADCREQHLVAQRLAGGLRLFARPVPPPDLARRITARVLADHRARLRWRRRVWTAAAVAACLAVMTFAGYQAQRLGLFQPGGKDPERIGKKDDGAPGRKDGPRKGNFMTEEHPAPPPLDQTLGEASSLALALTRRTADETMAQAREWWPLAKPLPDPLSSLKSSPPLAPVLKAPAQSLREAGQNVSAGLEPVTTSARRAINLFLHEMPPLDSGRQEGS